MNYMNVSIPFIIKLQNKLASKGSCLLLLHSCNKSREFAKDRPRYTLCNTTGGKEWG